jgi:protein-S-isoprenylcysteine O-methyltransferase Ste14
MGVVTGNGRLANVLRPAVLERFEQVLIVGLWVLLVMRIDVSTNPFAPLLLLSETAAAIFILIRRRSEQLSMRLGDWFLAVTATCASLLVVPGATPIPALIPLGIIMMGAGNVMQAWAKLVLRRSFGVAPANRGLKLTGPYRFVRHPMYAGYLLVHVSFLILLFEPINLVIYGIGWWAQILRLLAEERLLGEDPAYRDYMKQVRWRLIPSVF